MTHQTIIVPLDGSEYSERALPVATSLADRAGADLLLVTAAIGGPLHIRNYLNEKAEELRSGGCRVEVLRTPHGPVEALVHAVEETDDPVICMTTHGRGRLRWAAVGSVAEEVLRRVDHPIVLVGRHCRPDSLACSSRLLACVDGVGTGEALAPTVDDVSARLGLRIEVAIVVHPLDVASAEHEREMLDELSAPFAAVECATMISNRFVAGAIADHAESMPAAMIAMSAHGRHGFSRVALGSVTMGVVHLASCPVLVVRSCAPHTDASAPIRSAP